MKGTSVYSTPVSISGSLCLWAVDWNWWGNSHVIMCCGAKW
jgi:hypothetical protein